VFCELWLDDVGMFDVAEDYYKVLGVSRNAAAAEIQKAYRDLARKYHPDLNPNDKSAKKRFQEVQAAFDVLNDPGKREMYDRYGSAFESVGAGGGPQSRTTTWTGPGGGAGEAFDFSELFGDRFGEDAAGGFTEIFRQFRRAGGGAESKRRGAARGRDLEEEIEVPFATAVSGGSAQILVQQADGKDKTIQVKIPAGIDNGGKIRLRGQGEPGAAGAPAGDLLIRIRVAPHPCYRRHGRNLEVRVPITLAEAVSGAKIDVPTPNGTLSLIVPPGTSSGKRLRIKGHGVAARGHEPGDLYAEILVVLPHGLETQDREHLTEISQKYPQNPRGSLQW
jgi:DnaJ-class molecular chaperone